MKAPDPASTPQTPDPGDVSDPAKQAGPQSLRYPRGEKTAESPPAPWVDVDDRLPSLTVNVIVWGRRPSVNVCVQAYEARRWTGCISGVSVRDSHFWEWLTPTDQTVTDVDFWMPMPHPHLDR